MITVIILTLNEAVHLPGCLDSLSSLPADIVVLDSGSNDGTVEAALERGARVEMRPFDGYASQRNAALDLPGIGDWVLFVDADERLSPASAHEIHQNLLCAGDDVAGFWMPRRNIFFGRTLRGGGWWPDEQLRLLRRGRARYDPARQVHETVVVDGETRHLREPLLHLNYASWAEFISRQRDYAGRQAATMRATHRVPRRHAYLGAPAREFWRRFVRLGGYRDGSLGLRLALAMARHEALVCRLARAGATS